MSTYGGVRSSMGDGRFPDKFDREILYNEYFIKSIEGIGLTEVDVTMAKELFGDLDTSVTVVEVKEMLRSRRFEVTPEGVHYVVYYMSLFMSAGSLSVLDRVHMLINNVKLGWELRKYEELIDRVGSFYVECLAKSGRDVLDLVRGVELVNRVVSMDKLLLCSAYETLVERFDPVRELRRTLRFLPTMHYQLRRYAGDGNFRVYFCEGELLKRFTEDARDLVGMEISDLLDAETLGKVMPQLDTAVYNELSDFTIMYDGTLLRNTIRSEKCVDANGAEYVELLGQTCDVTSLQRSEERSRKLVYYDDLTQVANRDLFYKKLDEAFEETAPDRIFGVMFIDVDDFKLVNDRYGHDAGDELLVELAKRLNNCVRSGDVVARYAGDEFTLICNNVREREDLELIVNRIVSTIGQTPFVLSDGKELTVTLSMGVATYPSDGSTRDELLKNADIAMYKAKNGGKNKFRFFEKRMKSEELTKLEIKNDLRNALNRNELHLDYQLQYDCLRKKVVGIEALMRWIHPEKGMMAPGEFIEIAESSNMIIEMGYWAVDEGCRKLLELQRLGYSDIKLSINFSARQFKHDGLTRRVKETLDRVGIEPSALVVEITESTSMDNVEKTACILRELRNLGVLVSIDDFGTGYSSLSYLKEFPLTNLKIDKSFVHELTANAESHQLVNSIISLSNNLSLDVVAEGVETKAQYEILRDLGCTKFQGYYFGKPVSFSKLLDVLASGDNLEFVDYV